MNKIGGVGVNLLRQLNLRKTILSYLATEGSTTIPDLSKDINFSVPKVTSLVQQLIGEGLVQDHGKIESTGGRKPNLYGLIPDSGYCIGVEVSQDHVNIGLTNMLCELVDVTEGISFLLENTPVSLDSLCTIITEFVAGLTIEKTSIRGIGINLSGRVNHLTGHSYSYFHFDERPLSAILENKVGIPVYLENDSRAMAYGEFCLGVVQKEKNVLFLNLGYGIAVGILLNGQLYYGKSGYAGEFGHMPLFDNELMCHCGKKGCLETEASGWALTRMFQQKLQQGSSSILTQEPLTQTPIRMEDIVGAAQNDDVLAIELIARVGENLGRGLASLINVFNPELVVLGGSLAAAGDYLQLPIQTALNKYSISLVSHDTELKRSLLGERAGIIGACLLVRNRLWAPE